MKPARTGSDWPEPRLLPIRPRPATGESCASYVRRLARANHLRPNYLRRYLRSPDHDGEMRLDWLAVLAGRPVESLQRAFAEPNQPRRAPRHRPPAHPTRRAANKAVLFATIRRDANDGDRSVRALADRHGVHRRTVQQALASPIPPPRKRRPPRTSRLDPFKTTIDAILQADQHLPRRNRRSVKRIFEVLVAEHGMTDVSYSTLRGYVTNNCWVRTVPRTSKADIATTLPPASSAEPPPAPPYECHATTYTPTEAGQKFVSNHFEPYRQIVSPHDPDFTVHIATFEDLVRLQQEARDNRLNARWSSDDALQRQVEPDTTAILCPLLRNGRHESRPDSYRCNLWFAQRSERPTRTLSLLDVTATSLAALQQASSPDQLRRLIRMLLDGTTLDAIW